MQLLEHKIYRNQLATIQASLTAYRLKTLHQLICRFGIFVTHQYQQFLISNPQPIGFSGILLVNDKIHFIVHIPCTTEMSQTQNPLTP